MSPSWRGFLCLSLIINLLYFLFLDNFSFNNTKISNDLEIGRGYNLNSEKVETSHVSSFDPHNMCAKVERITAKTGCTSCTN